jgi:hypothetical protein
MEERGTDIEAISPSDAAIAVEPIMQRSVPQTSAVYEIGN